MPYYYGATGASEDGLHRWEPHTRRRLVRGNGRGAGLARVMLQEMRWRKPPRYVTLRIFAVVMTFVLHVVIFMLMSLGRAPAPTPGEAADVATIQVRLINPPKPPPPPPPIKMPVPKVGPAAQPKPHSARHAPTPATPPDQSEPAPAKPVQPHASQSPPAETSPDIATPPPRVVEEISRQAMPAPELDAIQIVPVKQPTSRLRPIPSQNQALTVTVGKTELKVTEPTPSRPQALAPAEVTATAPEVPSVQLAPTPQRVTPVARKAPSIAAQIQTTPISEPVVAQPAPLPQVPTATATPDLNLPVADVPVAQAPQVQVPAVQLEQPSIAVASPTQTASAASVAKPQASNARTADTWAPASDQFQPVPKRAGAQRSGVRHPSESKGQVQVPPQGNSDVMSRTSDRLGYKSTIFNQYWAPENETILDTFLRHMIERLTVKHTFHLAPGVRVHCFIGPLAIFAGCGGDPPRKASSKSHDSRLNMAPARSLAPNAASSAPARTSTTPGLDLDNTAKCATARVAGSPPPPGCPDEPAKPWQSDQWEK